VGWGDTNSVGSDLIPVYRTPNGFEQNNQFFPDGPHREKEDMSGRGARSEEEGIRRPTLYLVPDPDQDLACPSEVMMLVGTKEELHGKTGGGDVLGKGV
jgi:hypothetical protein